jgi:hypothetical protein
MWICNTFFILVETNLWGIAFVRSESGWSRFESGLHCPYLILAFLVHLVWGLLFDGLFQNDCMSMLCSGHLCFLNFCRFPTLPAISCLGYSGSRIVVSFRRST